MEIIATNEERRGAANRDERFSDLKWHDGGRVQRHVDPATIYAQYARARARRGWAITIIAALGSSHCHWNRGLLCPIAVTNVGGDGAKPAFIITRRAGIIEELRAAGLEIRRIDAIPIRDPRR